MRSRSTRVWLPLAAASVVLGVLVAWLLWPRSPHTVTPGYSTPRAAVSSTCHAAEVLATARRQRPAGFSVAWRTEGRAGGYGNGVPQGGTVWAALVVVDHGGYRVVECRYQHVAHG